MNNEFSIRTLNPEDEPIINNDIPELAIALLPNFRRLG